MIKITNKGGPCHLTVMEDGETVSLSSPYNKGFIDEVKRYIPDQRWDQVQKVRYFGPGGQRKLTELIKVYFGQEIIFTHVTGDNMAPPRLVTAEFDLWYLGLPRERQFAGKSGLYSLGHTDIELDSRLVFSLEVLQKWFAVEHGRQISLNYFQILGLPQPWDTATDTMVKHAYRVCAKTYHPDVNREPGAAGQFIRIKEAYDTIGREQPRKRYLFGLAATHQQRTTVNKVMASAIIYAESDVWMPPLRCGRVQVSGHTLMGQFLVDQILEWNDLLFHGSPIATHWDSDLKEVKFEYI